MVNVYSSVVGCKGVLSFSLSLFDDILTIFCFYCFLSLLSYCLSRGAGGGAPCLARKRCSTSTLRLHIWILEIKRLSHNIFFPINGRSPQMHQTMIANVQVKVFLLDTFQVFAGLFDGLYTVLVSVTSPSSNEKYQVLTLSIRRNLRQLLPSLRRYFYYVLCFHSTKERNFI